jgi:hypothetical protein
LKWSEVKDLIKRSYLLVRPRAAKGRRASA